MTFPDVGCKLRSSLLPNYITAPYVVHFGHFFMVFFELTNRHIFIYTVFPCDIKILGKYKGFWNFWNFTKNFYLSFFVSNIESVSHKGHNEIVCPLGVNQ